MKNDDTNFKDERGRKPEVHTWIDPELEARVVAWVAGEASAFETAELERLVAEKPELAIFKRRIEAVHGLVGEAARPDKEPLRMSEERRAKVLAAIGAAPATAAIGTEAGANVEVLEPKRGGKRPYWRTPQLYFIGSGLAAACLIGLVLSPQSEMRIAQEAAATRVAAQDREGAEAKLRARMLLEERENTEASMAAPQYLAAPKRPEPPARESEKRAEQSRALSGSRPVSVVADGLISSTANQPGDFKSALRDSAGASSEPIVKLDAFTVSEARDSVGYGAVSSIASVQVAAPTVPILDPSSLTIGGTIASAGTKKEFDGTQSGSLVLGQEKASGTGGSGGVAEANTLNYGVIGSVGGANVEGKRAITADSFGQDKVVTFGTPNANSTTGAVSPGAVTLGASTAIGISPSQSLPATPPTDVQFFNRVTEKDASKPVAFSDVAAPAPMSAAAATERAGVAGRAPAPASPPVSGLSEPIALSAFTVSDDRRGNAAGLAFNGRRAVARVTSEDEAQKRGGAASGASETYRETNAAKDPVSTFSLHVSDVSFRLAVAAVAAHERGEDPTQPEIRAEEFYNAFDYGDPAATAAEKIGARIEQSVHPVLQQRNLLRIAMKVPATGRAATQPLRLTVLLDTSGSMEREDRSQSVRRALQELIALLGAEDRVTLIGFARRPRLLAEAVPGNQAAHIVEIAARTPAEGGTNLEEALKLAGELAGRHWQEKAQNRIVLLTDGAANLGNADPTRLASLVETLRQRRIAFDACGVGLEGVGDAVLEALTRKGDGRYSVIDRPEAADAAFARQLAGAFRPAAENVKLQVRFNPSRVASYRLIGFNQHRLLAQDFRNDKVDAAELAANEDATALYQVEVLPQGTGEIGEVFVRFRDPASGEMVERSWTIRYEPNPPRFVRASPSLQLAGLSMLLAEKLDGSPYAAEFRPADYVGVANAVREHYKDEPRVQELVKMFEVIRRMTPP